MNNKDDVLRGALRTRAIELAEKLAPVYELLQWKWRDGVPNEDRIRKCLFELIDEILTSVSEGAGGSISTGGLSVEAADDKDGNLESISLNFVLSESVYLNEVL